MEFATLNKGNIPVEAVRSRLRTLGISEMGIEQFALLSVEQQTGILALIEQYIPNEQGNLRDPES